MTSNTVKKGKLNRLKTFDEQIADYRNVIKESLMLQKLVEQIEDLKNSFKIIRCLAIGGFTDDFPARYQLALLLELYDVLLNEESKILVSIYDPVFTDEDKAFISNMGDSWSIEETITYSEENVDSILYFLPHAPLDLTEDILINEKPKYWLANNIIQHVDRYTKLQLHEKYPLISKLVHVLEARNPVYKKQENNQDGFSTFVSKKKRRNNKFKLQEVEIDYDNTVSYFNTCKILTDFDSGDLLKDKPWINAFSDLTLHLIE